MGRPSARRHSARRPGRRERAACVKNRCGLYTVVDVLGGNPVHFQSGRKKYRKICRAVHHLAELAHPAGDPWLGAERAARIRKTVAESFHGQVDEWLRRFLVKTTA